MKNSIPQAISTLNLVITNPQPPNCPIRFTNTKTVAKNYSHRREEGRNTISNQIQCQNFTRVQTDIHFYCKTNGEKLLPCHIPNSYPYILFVHSIETTYVDHLRRMWLSNKILLSSEEHVFLFWSPITRKFERKINNFVRKTLEK